MFWPGHARWCIVSQQLATDPWLIPGELGLEQSEVHPSTLSAALDRETSTNDTVLYNDLLWFSDAKSQPVQGQDLALAEDGQQQKADDIPMLHAGITVRHSMEAADFLAQVKPGELGRVLPLDAACRSGPEMATNDRVVRHSAFG